MALESSELYQLISKATRDSLRRAMNLIPKMSDEECCRRSDEDNSTYLHHIVNQVPLVYKRYGDISPLIPLVYRLAIRGISVNAQNSHGNNCLMLACLRPHGESLCPHLLRIGGDPSMMNKKQCRIIHTFKNNRFVVVKGQKAATSGLWNAVEREDLQLVENLLKTYCRVNVYKNKKSIQDVGDETGNVNIVKLLARYRQRNELVTAAFACDTERTQELLRGYTVIADESYDVPKPLIVALEELGDLTKNVVALLRKHGARNGAEYEENVDTRMCEFESSEFYRLIKEETSEAYCAALDLLANGKVDLELRSFKTDTNGWNYLHYLVDKYNNTEDLERERLLIRMMYRLALAGIDVNARDNNGVTPLHKAASKLDQKLMTHVIRMGGDAGIPTPNGTAVNMEIYQDKGKMVFDRKYRQADQPGLWVAVETNDIGKAERWLKSWCRVNVKRGDRRLIDIARAMRRKEIVHLLEQYDHINEFVCATFACDLKLMMHLLALGKGKHKVNTIDDFFHVGFTWDRHAEYMCRPIIISAMEICSPEVVDFLLNFGADLSKQHEESEPCGPIAFWAFRNHVDNKNALVVAKHADVELRDELGATMLHRVVQKKWKEGKGEIMEVLLERGLDVGARDHEGSTARDYLNIYEIEDEDILRQIIDDHVLELVNNDQHYSIESLMLECYDHICDIRGTKRHKTAAEIAHLKEYKDIVILLEELIEYRAECDLLHQSACTGDLRTISKLSGEKRCATSRDKAGRTLLHNACLYDHRDMVKFLVEQYPNLINSRDSLNRTPLHYCVCLEDRQAVWQILLDVGADSNLIDANNLSVYDYVRELEKPTPTNNRPRGRRWQDYRPSQLIQSERNKLYGAKAETYAFYRKLTRDFKKLSLSDIKAMTKDFQGSLAIDDLDIEILKMCVDEKRQEIGKHLITACGARPDMTIKTEKDEMSLKHYARKAECEELAKFVSELLKEIKVKETREALQLSRDNSKMIEQEQI